MVLETLRGRDMIRLQFFGATRTVTGSQRLMEVKEQRILLACGMYQGKRAEAYERNRDFPLGSQIHQCDGAYHHAHIDRSGKAANSPFCPNLHLREQGG